MSINNDRNVGRALRIAAVVRDLTQRQLAEATGLSRETVSKHMRGETTPNVDQLLLYSEVLGCQFLIGNEAPAVGLEPATYRFTASSAA